MAEAISVSKPVSNSSRGDSPATPGKVLTFETGKLAPQSQGSVVASLGETTVLITANAESSTREGIDFFPLTIDIEEKAYAAGKIPGSFFRREARPPDSAILTCRLIDRPLRPSFAAGYRNETQVVGTVIGADQVNPYDVVAINGASAALMISGIPFEGPVGAVRLAYSRTGEWIPYPTYDEGNDSTFEIVVAGRQTDSGDIAIMMVEASGTENAFRYYDEGAPKVTEAVVASGLDAAKVWIKESIDLQNELVTKTGGRKPTISFVSATDYGDDVFDAVSKYSDQVLKANTIADKTERNAANDAVKAEIRAAIGEQFAGREKEVSEAIRSLTKKLIRKRVVTEGIRMDGRGVRDLRPVSAEVGVIPTAHGSGLFQRGETQVLNVTTLGMPRMDQLLDTLDPEDRKRYMHHYNMPPYANGETGRMGGTKRRELGHGLLAERAVLPVVPAQEDWPYAIRLVSEVLSSNGSTSMGSVCASSLSLMDAGVPLREHVAGIAMGLIYDDGDYIALTDILGSEDAFGDMDFKVAGTADVVTALQLDTKIDGLPADVLAAALDQAKEARLAILEVMKQAIPEPRAEVRGTAPKIISFPIPLDRIGEVIGPKGKVINTIQQDTGADIAVDDDGVVGTVTIGSKDGNAVEEARRTIELILNPPSVELGTVYKGRVVNITKFGAFVNVLPGRDGLVHISKLGGGKRIDKVEDVVNLGDELDVIVEDIDPNGKVSLRPVGEGFDGPEGGESGGGRERRERAPREDRAPREPREESGSTKTISFEDEFEAELKEEFGDLGPASSAPAGDSGGDRDRNRRPRGGRSGGGRR